MKTAKKKINGKICPPWASKMGQKCHAIVKKTIYVIIIVKYCTILDSCLFSAVRDVSMPFRRWDKRDFSACRAWFSRTISAIVTWGSALPCATEVSRVTVCFSVDISSTCCESSFCRATNWFLKSCIKQHKKHFSRTQSSKMWVNSSNVAKIPH